MPFSEATGNLRSVHADAQMLIYGMFEGFMQPLRNDIPASPTSRVEPRIVSAFVVLIFFGVVIAAGWF
jgi:hypothetical protein